tara:strand:+ start:213 stop:323 length:111 start_codon:yes stop_codon:yes gene_type:complete
MLQHFQQLHPLVVAVVVKMERRVEMVVQVVEVENPL